MAWVKERHRRRRQPVRRLLPRPRRPTTLRRHLLLPPRRRTRRQPRGSQGPRGRLARPLPRRGHLRRLRRDRLAALQARRDLHPGRLPVLPRQALHPVLRPPADGQDPPLRGPALGHHRHRRTASRRARSASTTPCCPRSSNAPSGDRVVTFNPCAHTELPKVVKQKARTLTPDEYDAHPRRAPRPASADGRDRDQHRPALGRAHRPQTPPPRLPAPHAHRRGDHRRGLQARTPPPASGCSPSPTPRTTNPAPSASARAWLDAARRRTSRPTARPRRPAVRHPRRHPDLAQHLPHPRLAARRQSRPASTSTSASTTCATPTPPGCSPAAPTSSPSWTAWATPRSRPPRNTSTPSPTPTKEPRRPHPHPDTQAPVTHVPRPRVLHACPQRAGSSSTTTCSRFSRRARTRRSSTRASV